MCKVNGRIARCRVSEHCPKGDRCDDEGVEDDVVAKEEEVQGCRQTKRRQARPEKRDTFAPPIRRDLAGHAAKPSVQISMREF